MNAATKVSAFALALVALLGGGWLLGRAVGPVDADAADAAVEHDPHAAMAEETAVLTEQPGLASAQNGYLFVPESTTLQAGVARDFRFRITDAMSAPITQFAVEHDKRLHLVVVRRDATRFQHVHPEMAADGTWSVPLTLPEAGSYRVFADFRPEDGKRTTLGLDVQVPGDYRPTQADGESRTGTVDDYTVRLDGQLAAGGRSTVTLSVARNGAPVDDLQPYLGAFGHLVALRGNDLAYLHVHPEAGPAGPEITFEVQAPTSGRYRLFFDFQHGDVVRTADFTVDVAAPGTTPTTSGDDGHGHSHGDDGHGG